MWCKMEHAAHRMLIMSDPAHDWQGSIAVCCWACYKERNPGCTEADFKGKARRCWRQRKATASEHAEVARGQTWRQVTTEYVVRMPGESQAAHRKRVLSWISGIAAMIVSHFERCTAEQQRKMVLALDEWAQTKADVAADPYKVPQLDVEGGLVILPDQALQLLSQISDGLDEYFCCRWLEPRCLFFCPNVYWASDGAQYACSQCLQQYRPWVARGHLANFQKVMVMAPKERITTASGYILEPGQVEILPCEWEDTSSQRVKNAFKEVCANITEEARGWTRPQMMQRLTELVANSCQRSYFRPCTMSATATRRFKENPRWNTAVIEGEFPGAFYDLRPNTPVLSFEDTVRVWAYSRHLIDGVRGRS
jgi:hypothetical protein